MDGACIKGVVGNVSHNQNLFVLKTGRNDLVQSPRVLGSFPRVLELKMGVLGLRFYLACKTSFIYNPGSLSGKSPRLTWTLIKYCCLNFSGP